MKCASTTVFYSHHDWTFFVRNYLLPYDFSGIVFTSKLHNPTFFSTFPRVKFREQDDVNCETLLRALVASCLRVGLSYFYQHRTRRSPSLSTAMSSTSAPSTVNTLLTAFPNFASAISISSCSDSGRQTSFPPGRFRVFSAPSPGN